MMYGLDKGGRDSDYEKMDLVLDLYLNVKLVGIF